MEGFHLRFSPGEKYFSYEPVKYDLNKYSLQEAIWKAGIHEFSSIPNIQIHIFRCKHGCVCVKKKKKIKKA